MIEIQVEDDHPFMPEEIIEVGNVFGKEEKTLPEDAARSFRPSSHYTIIHYVLNGREFENYYKNGAWSMGTGGIPRFRVNGLLKG